MGAAAAAKPGGMAAVSGASLETVERALAEATLSGGTLVIGAVNAPAQVTVSGDKALVEAFVKSDIRHYARVTPLRVSGAWHSPHMAEAAGAFEHLIGEAAIANAALPLIRNRDGEPVESADDLRVGIAGQLIRPVRWDRVMVRLFDMGIRDFVEIGPGKVLRGLVRLNDETPSISVHNISDLRSLDRAVSALQDG